MRYIIVFGFILIVLVLPYTFANADCANDTNATYEPNNYCFNGSCTDDAIKTCKTGYTMVGRNNSQSNITCYKSQWEHETISIKCSACSNDTYGDQCFNNCRCENKPDCKCDNVEGCMDTRTSNTCSQEILELELHPEVYYATNGIVSKVTLNASVNIYHEDVIVKVSSSEEELEYDNGFYTYVVFITDRNVSGISNFTFTAVSRNYSDISDTKRAILTIYDPVVMDIANFSWSPSEVTYVTENDKKSWTCKAVGYPRPDVFWTYGGGFRVENYTTATGDRITQYQSFENETATVSILYIRPDSGILKEDAGTYRCAATNSDRERDYRQSAQLTIEVRDPGHVDPVYNERDDFLIGIITVGIALFILIVVFIIYVVWTSWRWAGYQAVNQGTNKNKTRPNAYTADHLPRTNCDEVIPAAVTYIHDPDPQPLSPESRPVSPIERLPNPKPLRKTIVAEPPKGHSMNHSNSAFIGDYGETYEKELPIAQRPNKLPNLNSVPTLPSTSAMKTMVTSPSQVKILQRYPAGNQPPPPPRNPSQATIQEELYSEPAEENYESPLAEEDTYQDVGNF